MNKFFKTALITLLGLSCATIAVAQDTTKKSSVDFSGYAIGSFGYNMQKHTDNTGNDYKINEIETTAHGRLIVKGTTQLNDWTTQGILRFAAVGTSTSTANGVEMQRAYAVASNKTIEISAGLMDPADIEFSKKYFNTNQIVCGHDDFSEGDETTFAGCDYDAGSDFVFGSSTYVQVGYVALDAHKVYALFGHGPKTIKNDFDITKGGQPIDQTNLADTPYGSTSMGLIYKGSFDVTSTDKLGVNAAFYYGLGKINPLYTDVNKNLEKSTFDGLSIFQTSVYANYDYNNQISASLGFNYVGKSTGDKDVENKDEDGNASKYKKSESLMRLVGVVNYTIDSAQGASAIFTYNSDKNKYWKDGNDVTRIQAGLGYSYALSSNLQALGFARYEGISTKTKDKSLKTDKRSDISLGTGLGYSF